MVSCLKMRTEVKKQIPEVVELLSEDKISNFSSAGSEF